MKHRVERQVGQEVLGIETGVLAKQAAGSVLVTYGETTVLVAAATGAPRAGIDFFPLTCDYRERTAAAGLTASLCSSPIEFSLNFLGAINLNNPKSVKATAMIVNAKLVSIFIPFF